MARGATREELAKAESGDYLTLDPFFCRERQATRVLGGCVSSRMHALVQEASDLLRAGVNPADILMVCATPSAAASFSQALRQQVEEPLRELAEQVEATVARSVAMQVLATSEAQGIMSRTFPHGEPRLLSAFEVDFILEDLKTFGTRAKRLREVLKFIYRGWTELADECEGWLVTVEEKDIVAFLHDELSYLQAVMEPELSNFACKALRQVPSLLERFGHRHVLVSDYQLLSRASQLMCNALAQESIFVTADEKAVTEVYESYPYLEGVKEFTLVNPGTQTYILNTSPRDLQVKTVTWDLPEDEMAGVADRIASQIAAGSAPESIAAVCFHPYWYNGILRALGERGVPINGLFRPLALKGDVRDLERACALRMVTVLRLLDDPRDSMSWRCWIGYGDYLGKSLSFVPARKETQQKKPDAVFADEAIRSVAAEQLKPLLESCQGKTGLALLEHLAQCLAIGDDRRVPALLRPLAAMDDSATPHDMIARLEEYQFFPKLSQEGGVVVGSLETVASLEFNTIYTVGFVNGLFPQRKYFDLTQVSINQQQKMDKANKRLAAALVSTATHQLAMSHFSRAEHEFAERCGLKQDRIFIEPDGVRYGRTSLSIYAKEIASLVGK